MNREVQRPLDLYKVTRRGKSLPMVVFLVVLIAELIGAYVLIYKGEHIMGDALSRTANAYYVLYVRPYKLASIGFVWNPLPSLLQLPILLFAQAWPPLATHGIAGCIVTALFSAFNAAYLARCFLRTGLGVVWTLLLVGLYAFNPFIFFYGCNGMSESLFFTTMIVPTVALARWIETRKTTDLMLISVMLAIGFLCRYEAIPFAASIAMALMVIIFILPDPLSPFGMKSFSMKFHHYVSTCVVVFMPLAYSILVWIFLNWSIMGDPLYFLTSAYSNSAQSEYGTQISLAIIFTKMAPFALLFLVVVCERLVCRKLIKGDFLAFLLLVTVITLFHLLMAIKGTSFGWLRFFCLTLPICMAWLPYEFMQMSRIIKYISLVSCVCALLASCMIVNAYMLYRPDIASEEYEPFMQQDVSGIAMQFAAARRINEYYPNEMIMLDAFTASAFILNLDSTERLIMNNAPDFYAMVKQPWKYGARYILVPDPGSVGRLDAFNMEFPDLYSHGAEWCVEREDFGNHKLFEVTY